LPREPPTGTKPMKNPLAAYGGDLALIGSADKIGCEAVDKNFCLFAASPLRIAQGKGRRNAAILSKGNGSAVVGKFNGCETTRGGWPRKSDT